MQLRNRYNGEIYTVHTESEQLGGFHTFAVIEDENADLPEHEKRFRTTYSCWEEFVDEWEDID